LTTDAFDRAFGSVSSTRAGGMTFAERLGRADARPSEATEQVAGTGQYKPYGYLPTNSIGETCDVQRWLDGTEVAEGVEFQYRFLMQTGYVGEEQIRLFLPDCIILIEGRNLRELRKKLARRQVTFIQQYSPKVWPEQPMPGEAFISRIQVLRPGT
jgi:hypothetical protein